MTCTLVAVVLTLVPADPGSADTVIRLTVQPMPAPKPALKYQLLPELRELKPGNPVQGYVRCFMEQRNFFYGKGSVADRNRYQTLPLAELPAKDLREYGGGALRQADWAARLDSPDWQVLDRIQEDGVDHQASELPALQVLAAALQVRFRGQVAGRHFDDAVSSAKTMFALARHLGEYPTEEANLVGISIAQLAIDTLAEMVQQPGCPNLYWALTDLPVPLVDLRKGVQGTGTLMETEFRPLRDDAVLTEGDLEKVVTRLSGVLGLAREQAGRPPKNLRTVLDARVKDADRVKAAIGRLIDAGCDKALVGKMLPMQIVLLDEKREYEIMRDEGVKLLPLSPWQMDALIAKAPPGEGLFVDLLPKVVQFRRAQGRMEQRIALLRYVEALRMYAAEHSGRLPEKLSEFGVPLPADPFTGKPFHYTNEKAIAHLRGDNFHYEVTVRK